MTFQGQTVLITGAAVGIGRATAMNFAKRGANVVLVDMSSEKLEHLKKELSEYKDKVLTFVCDVSDEAQVNKVVELACEKYKNIDILVNNAGIWRDSGSFENISSEMWKKYLDVNLMGTVYFTKAVIVQMKERRFGRIINIASVAGVYGNGNSTHYSATKGAMIAMTKALAKEVAKYGITVNSISPGTVSPSENPDPNYWVAIETCYVGRTGTNMENANLICFIASREADYISGQNILIDGCRRML